MRGRLSTDGFRLPTARPILSTIRIRKERDTIISARNDLKGKIKRRTPGAVNTEVIVELAGGAEVVSIITKESAQRLQLATGKEVFAVIKASDVMIAID